MTKRAKRARGDAVVGQLRDVAVELIGLCRYHGKQWSRAEKENDAVGIAHHREMCACLLPTIERLDEIANAQIEAHRK